MLQATGNFNDNPASYYLFDNFLLLFVAGPPPHRGSIHRPRRWKDAHETPGNYFRGEPWTPEQRRSQSTENRKHQQEFSFPLNKGEIQKKSCCLQVCVTDVFKASGIQVCFDLDFSHQDFPAAIMICLICQLIEFETLPFVQDTYTKVY